MSAPLLAPFLAPALLGRWAPAASCLATPFLAALLRPALGPGVSPVALSRPQGATALAATALVLSSTSLPQAEARVSRQLQTTSECPCNPPRSWVPARFLCCRGLGLLSSMFDPDIQHPMYQSQTTPAQHQCHGQSHSRRHRDRVTVAVTLAVTNTVTFCFSPPAFCSLCAVRVLLLQWQLRGRSSCRIA